MTGRCNNTKALETRDKNITTILDCIKNNPHLSGREISRMTGISDATVSLRTRELVEKGIIRCENNGRRNYYSMMSDPAVGAEKKEEKIDRNTYAYTRAHQYSKETADKVLEVIRDNPGINTNDLISKANVSEKTIRCVALDLEDDNRITSSIEFESDLCRHIKHYWIVESEKTPEATSEPATETVVESKKEENEVERYPEHKNDEGYNDLTAAPTIKKLDDIFGVLAPGAVWTLSTAYGADAEYLVLRSYKGWVTGMMLQDDLQQYSPVYCVPVSMRDKRYVDCRRILTKPSKYFIEKCYDIPNFDRVRSKVCYLLGIEPEVVEKVVEKPVEVTKEVEVVKEVPVEVIKEVEKPVEVIKEVPVEVIKEVVKEVPVPVPVEVEKTVDAVDTALLRQKADIYERIAWQFLNTLSNVAEEVER